MSQLNIKYRNYQGISVPDLYDLVTWINNHPAHSVSWAEITGDNPEANTTLKTYLEGKYCLESFAVELDGRVETLETDVPALETRVQTAETDIDTLNTDVSNLDGRALKTPLTTPTENELVGIDTTNAQARITLGQGLTLTNNVLSASGKYAHFVYVNYKKVGANGVNKTPNIILINDREEPYTEYTNATNTGFIDDLIAKDPSNSNAFVWDSHTNTASFCQYNTTYRTQVPIAAFYINKTTKEIRLFMFDWKTVGSDTFMTVKDNYTGSYFDYNCNVFEYGTDTLHSIGDTVVEL